jgi:ArsR family transcriptional regulator
MMDAASQAKTLAAKQAAVCGVFANPTRILILWTLAEEEKSVSDIAETVEASLQNTSQHLRLMKNRGILISRREAQTIYYRVADNEYTERCQLLFHAYKKKRTRSSI